MLKKLVLKNRSYFRFSENQAVSEKLLRDLVDLSRYAASAGNKQPLKYIISCTPEKNAKIFAHVGWAAPPHGSGRPKEGERPAAYIIMLGDREIAEDFGVDQGIAAQTILLAAVEKELGGCMLGSLQREALRQALDIPYRFDILLVIALGTPAETVLIEEATGEGPVDYWLDKKSVHHVPKRTLEEIILDQG
jgi:nitroreductase